MSNMSYCRFQNTLIDLRDCHTNMEGSKNNDRLNELKEDLQYSKDRLEQHKKENKLDIDELLETIDDLEDEINEIEDDKLSREEENARRELIELCKQIAEEHEDKDEL